MWMAICPQHSWGISNPWIRLHFQPRHRVKGIEAKAIRDDLHTDDSVYPRHFKAMNLATGNNYEKKQSRRVKRSHWRSHPPKKLSVPTAATDALPIPVPCPNLQAQSVSGTAAARPFQHHTGTILCPRWLNPTQDHPGPLSGCVWAIHVLKVLGG